MFITSSTEHNMLFYHHLSYQLFVLLLERTIICPTAILCPNLGKINYFVLFSSQKKTDEVLGTYVTYIDGNNVY